MSQHASPDARKRRLREFAESTEKHSQFDSLWNELLESSPEDVETFLFGASGLEAVGMMEKAGKLLAELALRQQELKAWRPSLVALRKVADIAPRERALRHGLVTAFKNLFADDPRLPVYLRASRIETETDLKSALARIETYFAFEPGKYVWHPQGWGAGKISEIDAEQTLVLIDFEKKAGHRLSMEMARTITEFIEDDDLRAFRFDRFDALKSMIEDDPVELLRTALRSRRNKATLRDLRDRLTDGVIETAAWSKWWSKTRTKLKSASDVKIAPGANPVVELAKGETGYAQNCLRDVKLLDDPSKQAKYLKELIREAAQNEDGEEAVRAVVAHVANRERVRTMEPGPRIALSFLVQEAKQAFPSVEAPEELVPEKTCDDVDAVVAALPAIPSAAQRTAAVRSLVEREPARRVEIHKKVVLRGEPDTADECFSSLARAGDKAAIAELTREINEKFRDHPFAFAWFAKAAVAGKLPQGVDVPSPPQLLEKVLLLHNHLDQLFYREDDPELRRLSKALSSMLIAKSCRFVKEGLDRAAATDSEARNIDKIIRNNRSLPEDIRDKVLAAMLRTRPELGKREEEPQSRPGVPASDPNILYATDEGVTRRRKEYETLVNVLIPENAAEIGRAASYGDLSENAEWSAAIEKQTQLTRKSEDMIAELNRVRIIDPEMQDGEHATLGSRVKLAAEDGKQFDYVVLGPFEADNEKGVISYLSPLGASILGRKKGEEFAVETPSGSVKYRVLEVSDGLKHLEA